ncbi:glycosyltransferase family 39 protein [Anaeromyxobacter sp. PSR-1]|uniref:ArnT family glycosyltransferase n=1 Tax=Anaeromyxobacter sp. PSR-1 TaxID=1300915 RepID=UPI0005E06F79|nr:glycosyltransferase family 39 protein [Anaeromyxobacter sp. PSR-1]GAO03340.1 hypothetical protein PSR1_02224 [Anaeromyxobacter sp. PSR-1]
MSGARTRPATLAWAAIAVVTLASGVLYATLPPSPDQWFLGYTGWRLAEGDVPYTGFADGNWPGSHWLHALSVLLLGNTAYTWRVFDFALMVIAVAFAAATARSLWGPRAGRWLLGLYPPLYVVLGRWFAGERDIVGAHLLFVAIWFYWSGLVRGRARWQLGTGALIALAALVKPTFAAFGPLLALHCLGAVPGSMRRLRERIAHVAVAGAAAVGGVLAGFAALIAEGADLRQFWELAVQSVVVRYGSDTVGGATFLSMALQNFLRSWHFITAGAIAGLAARLARREPEGAARNLLFPTLWATGIVTYLAQGQALGYTLGVAYAATVPILCSGLGLLSLSPGMPRGRAVAVAALLAVPVLGTAKKWTGEFRSSVAWLTGRIDAATHYGAFGAGDGMSAAQAMALAAELKAAIPPGGTILVWGRANVVNFLAERPQPTRFHHNVTIMRRYLPARLADKWNGWFRDEVTAHAPQACVVNEGELDGTPPVPPSITFLERYLGEHYRRVRTVGESGLYLRR